MSVEFIHDQILASIAAKQSLLADEHLIGQIEKISADCIACLRSGGKIIFAGNGGSFADAQHLSAEFVSRFMFNRAPLASVVLGANNSTISAIGNDYGYDCVFARELEAIAKPFDLFMAISTSGNSPNILAAVFQAKALGLTTFALTGRNGGKLVSICDCVRVPSTETARIQECHITIGHIVCGIVEQTMFSEER